MTTVTAPAPERADTGTPKRYAHAFPEGSLVALCGRLRPRNVRPYVGTLRRCPICEAEAQRKSFVGR